ncbi:TolC family protein, partial [Acidihalobacter prosperus]
NAGLIPDPSLGYHFGRVTSTGPGLVNAYSTSLSEGLKWLVTRGARVNAARAKHLQQVLKVAWQSWQVSQRTQQLYVRLWSLQRQAHLLERNRQLDLERQHRVAQALKRGDVTLNTAAADLVNLTNIESKLAKVRESTITTRSKLNTLLDLQANAKWHLKEPHPSLPPNSNAIKTALKALPQHRPDLLALQAGYQSADDRYRAAILGQFPALHIGISRASDTTDVKTTGIGITLTLPFFNGNRGQIAIARATRKYLRAQYQARLDQATNKARTLADQLRTVSATQKTLSNRLPELQHLASNASHAFSAGNLNGASYIAIQSSLIARELEAIRLRQHRMEDEIALNTLLGHIPTGAPKTQNHPKEQ